MRFKGISICAAAAAMMMGGVAHADLITNGGFETNGPTDNNADYPGIGSTEITGWTVINNDGSTSNDGHNAIWIGDGGYGLYTPFGTDFVDLTGTSDATPFVGVSQSISTHVGQQYTLTFYLGAQGTTGGFGGPISVTANAGSTSQVFNDPGTTGTLAGPPGPPPTVWTEETLNFTATSESTDISIVGKTGEEFIGLDNVAVNAASISAAPEPSTWALMLIGVGGLGYAMRRSQRAQGVRFA